MRIVLEGPDNTGKSTLALAIQAMFPYPIQPSEGPEKFPGEMNARIRGYLDLDPVIFDRHPCVSQPIYSQFNGTSAVDPGLLQQFYDQRPLFIYCPNYAEQLTDSHVVKSHDTPSHLEAVKSNHRRISALYHEWAIKHARIIYRMGESVRPLLSFINEVRLNGRI